MGPRTMTNTIFVPVKPKPGEEAEVTPGEKLPIFPAGYRVLVKQMAIETKSKGGIMLYSRAEEKRQQKGEPTGILMAVGPLAWKHERLGGEPWAKVGDMVRFGRYAGDAFKEESDGSHWHIMNDEDILGVIPEGGE